MNPRLEKIAQRAASSLETLQTSYDLARLAIQNGVPGDFVECGVFQGAQCAAMALAIKDAYREWQALERHDLRRIVYDTSRRIHLFDSFSGVPAAGPHDKQWRDAGHPEGQSAASFEQVGANMAEWGIDPALLVYHCGFFDDTMNFDGELAVKRIAILRLDGDLYESTKVCIEQLYPLVSPGGWVIVDDFALDGARKAVMDFMGGGGAFPPICFQKHV